MFSFINAKENSFNTKETEKIISFLWLELVVTLIGSLIKATPVFMAIAEVLEKSIIALKSFSIECQIRSACYVFINGKTFFLISEN